MAYRTVDIAWKPRSKSARATVDAARMGAAALWNAMILRHTRILRLGLKAPPLARWEKWSRGKTTGISAQTRQQIVMRFCTTQMSAARARARQRSEGQDVTAKRPWRTPKYRDVPYTNQAATITDGWLRLPNGQGGGVLRVKIPRDIVLPGRLMEATLGLGKIRLTCKTEDGAVADVGTIGVDLGINTMIAATDGETAVVVNGREVQSIQQYRNKKIASNRSAQSRMKVGSKRHKKLSVRRRKMARKCARKIHDICHKATRVVADAFPNSHVIVGESFQSASRKNRAVESQKIGQAWTGRISYQLEYKLCGAKKVPEHYSSQTCPVCGCLRKCKRVYRCKACGLVAPRDVVGAVNIRAIGLYGELTPTQSMPTVVRFVRPLRKYPRPPQGALGSSGGTPASSSEAA